MNWLALILICMNILAIQTRRRHGNNNVRNLIDFIRNLGFCGGACIPGASIQTLPFGRRQFDTGRYGAPILGSPRHPEHLPAAEPVYPGHSLIRPAKGHLKSSIKYPLRDVKNTLVYGNPSNLGIMYGNENDRVQYSDFRRDRRTGKLLRKQFDTGRYGAPILGSPRHPEHLPPAEPVYPGHSLIRPAKGHLKSSIKYPLRDVKNTLVYGNPSNLGIMYGNENERVQYSDFRRGSSTDKLLVELAQILQNHKQKNNKSPLAAIIKPEISVSSEENDAREELDIMDSDRNIYDRHDFRRHDKTKYRKRSNENDDTDDSESATAEKNPGNPFTVFKSKYKQNYMWNHFMDGDHMNINPFGPEFKNYGPSGFDLFLGRKWWYFNQDDFKPMS